MTIQTTPAATCDIDVEYYSGTATATGLGDKIASTTGKVTWRWKVGSNTTPGKWPILISCMKGTRAGSVETSFTVK